MKTLKKMLLLVSAALAVAALAAPGLAQADQLTVEGEPVKEGTLIKFKSTTFHYQIAGMGTFSCNEVILDAEVLKNEEELIKLEVFGTKYTGCSSSTTGYTGTIIQLANGKGTLTDFGFSSFCNFKGNLQASYSLEGSSIGVGGILSSCHYAGPSVGATFSMEDAETGLPVEILFL